MKSLHLRRKATKKKRVRVKLMRKRKLTKCKASLHMAGKRRCLSVLRQRIVLPQEPHVRVRYK